MVNQTPVPPVLLGILCLGLIVLVLAVVASTVYYRQAKQCETNPSPYCYLDWTCADGTQPRVTGFNTIGPASDQCDPSTASTDGTFCANTPSAQATNNALSNFTQTNCNPSTRQCCGSTDKTQCKQFT